MLTLGAVTTLGPSWLDPENLLTSLLENYGGLTFWIILGIIFAECGLLLGFFLPGTRSSSSPACSSPARPQGPASR